jgi:hypothetical protein
MAAVLSLTREVSLEDRLFSAAIILQMLMYTGRPLLGGARYLLAVYPAFAAGAAYAGKHWTSRQFVFYVASLGFFNLIWFRSFLNWMLLF